MRIQRLRTTVVTAVVFVLSTVGCAGGGSQPVGTATGTSSRSPETGGAAPTASDEGFIGEAFEVGPQPCTVTEGGGRAWVALHGAATVVGVDPADVTDQVTLSVGDQPCAMAWYEDQLWVAELGPEVVTAYDPNSGDEIHQVRFSGDPYDLAQWEGALWAIDRGGKSSLVRIDPQTGEETGRWPVSGSPSSLAIVDDGLWVARQGAQALDRFEAATEEFESHDAEGSPYWMTTLDGQIWYSDSNDGSVVRFDPQTGEVRERVTGPRQESELTAFQGNIWLPQPTGELWRVDPASATAEPVGEVPIGTYYTAPVGDELWILEYEGTRVVRMAGARLEN